MFKDLNIDKGNLKWNIFFKIVIDSLMFCGFFFLKLKIVFLLKVFNL